jgi:hypothetical protein
MSRAIWVFTGALLVASCSDGFGRPRGQQRLQVELVAGNAKAEAACTFNYNCEAPLGCVDTTPARMCAGGLARCCKAVSPLDPRPVKIEGPETFRIVVRALKIDGTQDDAFNSFVRISAKPGSVEPLAGPPGSVEGRNVRVTGGVSQPVDVRLVNAYGTTYLLADDLGYEPGDPFGAEPPACADGRDNDGDGRIDFPADEGCAFANDTNEGGGSYAQGASPPIYFSLPRIAQVRGVTCPGGACSGTGLTPYPKEQISIDTGYRERPEAAPIYGWDVVVTRIASDGFYAQDLNNDRMGSANPFGGFTGFAGIFAFTFNAPPRMRVCDRLKTFSGTANEFFGFTQVSYPTWTLEEWDPALRTCLVPEPDILSPSDARDEASLLPKSGKLVRVRTLEPNMGQVVRPTEVYITPKIGPGDALRTAAGFVTGPDNTNCDFNKDARIDFSPGNPADCNNLSIVPMPAFCEGVCANVCDQDPECSEFSNFRARSTFRLNLKDANGVSTAIQADASAFAGFSALANKGKLLRAFTGTLHYFSGGSQFTIEARCKDDVTLELDQQPLAADTRTDLKQPPPPLACVFPRTFLDNNPQ